MSDSLRPHGLQASPSFTISWSLLKLRSIESVMPSSHLILCRPLLLLPSIFPASGSFLMSYIFTSDMTIYWSFSLSISPSNEYSGLISFRIDWLDLLAVQGTLNSLLQHHSSKAVIETYLILRCMHIFLIYLLYHWLSVPLIIHIISYYNKYIL